MVLRYLYLHKRSLPRTLELVFWPVMDLLVWGFVTLYIQGMAQAGWAKLMVFLINAMIFWDVLYRSQQGVTISFMEEIWHQNLINLLASPLKIWEWVTATFLYGLIKTLVITLILTGVAAGLYQFNLITELGFYLIPLMANLLLFGWALGIFTSGLILRWGYAVEALIWGIPFVIQPISAIFYPLSVLPAWLQPISRAIPSTYVFEGMRVVLQEGTMPVSYVWLAFGLNLLYFLGGTVFFQKLFQSARVSGRLVRIGLD
jgi:ABC-2 type transport system permease protein